MSFDPTSEEWGQFQRSIENMPRDEFLKEHGAAEAETTKQYLEFKTSFHDGYCYLCNKPLATFSKHSPCLHWLLRPKGVKKESIREILTERGYFRSATYVRWVANQGKFMSRINDLVGEGNTDAYFHWTAKFQHIKWTFWCTQNDLQGHKGSHSSMPHYHIEIHLNERIFIKFNDFHVPFDDNDLFNFRCNADDKIPVKFEFGEFGAGMNDAMSVPPEIILSETNTTDDTDSATYNIQSVLMAEKGQTISMDTIDEALKKSQETGKPIAHFLGETGLNPQIHISPAESVVDKSHRQNPRKRPKK